MRVELADGSCFDVPDAEAACSAVLANLPPGQQPVPLPFDLQSMIIWRRFTSGEPCCCEDIIIAAEVRVLPRTESCRESEVNFDGACPYARLRCTRQRTLRA